MYRRNIGLARALSKWGYCSRSQAAELIRAGRVRLNGRIRRDPETPVHLEQDHIQIENRPLPPAEKLHLMLNKPRGLVTTVSDEQERKTIYDCLDPEIPWVAPVGRLDKASEGLLLLTNDSEWASRILAPESHLDKTYHVQISAIADAPLLSALRGGIRTPGGAVLSARSVRLLRTGKRNSWIEVVLDEGKNRQIRRMLAAFNVKVLRLVRVAIGPLVLGELPKGSFRALTRTEKNSIDQALRAARTERDPSSSDFAYRAR